ncbi:hypothetical protein E7X27_25780 [Klebsiella pneumoniae]|nr:hypothetical protein [Klebsiella pneumoniae]MDO7982802.1 hypothetical protein [Klebsiella pneumoniae]QJL48203.1 hypothetical protein HJX02_28565 [Klebsiella pneumoniae]RTA72429.1 hypothetical protein EJ501_11540 [Klebsiella pneumoniae subsp. pneumoniae]HBT2023532.1 hypothetical protein [Klebsiella pneumoniae]
MNNTLQLFWSGGLHIAKIFILHKKNTQLTQLKEELSKNQIAGQFLAVFPLFHPYRSIQFVNQHFILS